LKTSRFKQLFGLVLLLCSALLTYRLLYKAWIGSTDFHVYWKAAQDWLSGTQSPYYFDASTKGFVFKYPPWSLPIFAPFGMLSFDAAKMAWALVEFFCLIYTVYKIIYFGVRREIAFLVAVTLWWIWQDHFWSGQLTILLLASALWITDDLSKDALKKSPLKLSITAYLFTAKIFSVFTFLGSFKKFLNPRVIIGTGLFCLIPTLATWFIMREHDPSLSLIGVFQQFAAAAKSGGAELGEHVVRGQLNHGFTAAILRFFHVDSTQSIYDAAVCIGLTAVFGLIWSRFRSDLTEREYFFGWLALALITHPLAWDHSFILAYPLCAVSLERAVQTRDRRFIALSFFGCACIGLLIPNVIGTEAVKPFEYIAIKSWGVVFSAIALVLSQKTLARKFTI
jgi:hypothetical protein